MLATLLSGSAVDEFGRIVSLCDVNGDGYSDVIIGSPTWNGNLGRTYIFHSSGSSGINQSFSGFASSQISGTAAGGRFGSSITTGDLNGDGRADIVATAEQQGAAFSTVYVYISPVAIPGARTKTADATTSVTGIVGLGISLYGGLSFGDPNGDGFTDLFIGGNVGNGVYVFHSSAAGLITNLPAAAAANVAKPGFAMPAVGKTYGMLVY